MCNIQTLTPCFYLSQAWYGRARRSDASLSLSTQAIAHVCTYGTPPRYVAELLQPPRFMHLAASLHKTTVNAKTSFSKHWTGMFGLLPTTLLLQTRIVLIAFAVDTASGSGVATTDPAGTTSLWWLITFYIPEGMPRSQPSAGVNKIATAKPSPHGILLPN